MTFPLSFCINHTAGQPRRGRPAFVMLKNSVQPPKKPVRSSCIPG